MNNKQQVIDYFNTTFNKLDVGKFDILYIYTDLRFFGQYLPFFSSKDEFFKSIVDPLLSYSGTIIMTTFTYTSSGIFDITNSKTNLGAMNKWILSKDNHIRSEHPLFSFASLGKEKKIIQNIGKSAFGQDSVFDRLKNMNSAFLHIGRPVELGNTSVHHVEQICGATYRYNKCFKTKVYNQDTYIGTNYTAFLRKRDVDGEDFDFTFVSAARLLKKYDLVTEIGSPFKNISIYPFNKTIDFLSNQFYLNQNIFIKSNYKNYK